MKLFLKGDRCYSVKCPVETGRPAPGMHGSMRRRKISDYGTQLREKQRLRRTYGLQEKQFRLFFSRAASKRGVTGEILLQLLELRLDNIVYRLGFAPSRKAAREMVRHNHFAVNSRTASIPSMVLKQGDVVAVRNRPKSQEYAKQSLEMNGDRALSGWMSLDSENLKGEVLHVPSREEIAPVVNEQLIVELYSK